MSGETCSFTSGGTSVSAFCENGCCSDVCCGDSSTDGTVIAIIISCVIGGLILLLLLALCIWCILRTQEEEDDDEQVIMKSYKEEKKRIRGIKNTGNNGDKNKATQTANHKEMPGDGIVYARGKWVSSIETFKYKQYKKSKGVKEIGVNAVGTTYDENIPEDQQLAKIEKKGKLNSTANVYTRRDSLKGSSDEDDLYQTPNRPKPTSVNMYAYAAKDTSSADYTLNDPVKEQQDQEKLQSYVMEWKGAQGRWQNSTKTESLGNQTPPQKKWKEGVVFVQTKQSNDAGK